MTRTNIFTAYEKPEASEPTDRVVLVREGFAFWAFVLNILWLLANKLWLASAGYMLIAAIISMGGEALHLSPITIGLLQLLLQVMVGVHGRDLRRAKLVHQGYRFAGIIVAESPMAAEQRYYEHAA